MRVSAVRLYEEPPTEPLLVETPLIVLQTVSAAQFGSGWLGMQSLVSAGGFAASSFNTVTLLVCLLALFYVTESLERDFTTRFAACFTTRFALLVNPAFHERFLLE